MDHIEREVMKLCFKIMSWFWILSPVGFFMSWMIGKWNYIGKNWLIFMVLAAISTIVMFLNYESEKEVNYEEV